MPVSDPIADMLSRIRNANMVAHETVEIPASRMKVALTKILREEGYIKHYKIVKAAAKAAAKGVSAPASKKEGEPPPEGRHSVIRIYLKYGPRQERVINGLRRMSTPGRRLYVGSQKVPRVYGGLGVAILSTPRGVMTGQQARQQRLGGELLALVW